MMDDESGDDDRDELTIEEVSRDMTGEADGKNTNTKIQIKFILRQGS